MGLRKTLNISALIQPTEVVTSRALIDRVEATGVQRDAARQILHRHSNAHGLWQSAELVLPGRDRLYARPPFVGSEAFLNLVADLLRDTRPGISRIIRVLPGTQVLLRPEAVRLLATPISGKSSARFPTYESEVAALEEIRAVACGQENSPLEYLSIPRLVGTGEAPALALQIRGRLILEGYITRLLLDHFRQQGLISWNGYCLPDVPESYVSFNDFAFSATAYSWVGPLRRWRKSGGKAVPTPVVFDVYARPCRLLDVDSLIHRMERAARHPSSRLALLGIVAAPSFNNDAWQRAKDAGLITVNLHQMLGETAVQAMKQIQNLLEQIGSDTTSLSGAALVDLAAVLTELKSNPYVVAIKSMALELYAALVLRTDGWDDVRMNEQVPFGGNAREVDAYGHRAAGAEVRVIECKAESSDSELDPAYVKKFFTETVPALLKHRYPHMQQQVKAEIWTTGKLGQAAQEELKRTSLKKSISARLLNSSTE